jgi:hypothetical protein
MRCKNGVGKSIIKGKLTPQKMGFKETMAAPECCGKNAYKSMVWLC